MILTGFCHSLNIYLGIIEMVCLVCALPICEMLTEMLATY
jgi:hypothetical protein